MKQPLGTLYFHRNIILNCESCHRKHTIQVSKTDT